MQTVLEIVDGFSAVDPIQWDALVGDMPVLRHAFLMAFEQSKSVGEGTGWQSAPLLLKAGNEIKAAMPLYLKSHSYGEYVFDWSWADAFERHGQAYYPKLLSAIPFTPITSERLLAKTNEDREMLISGLKKVMYEQRLSSAHINFPDIQSEQILDNAGWIRRNGVQFRWENQGYASFGDFLATLAQPKRKKIRQERKKIIANQVQCRTILGHEITDEEWAFFYQCYTQTYLEHHSTPYLTFDFFQTIGRTMPENIVLFIAYQDGQPIASALNIYHHMALYGRYWGATKYVANLHFELCYYQAQEFCIEQNIRYFEGGAQGEHKLARGFTARSTCSFHAIARPEFSEAIQAAMQHEASGMRVYVDELEARSPYKTDMSNTD